MPFLQPIPFTALSLFLLSLFFSFSSLSCCLNTEKYVFDFGIEKINMLKAEKLHFISFLRVQRGKFQVSKLFCMQRQYGKSKTVISVGCFWCALRLISYLINIYLKMKSFFRQSATNAEYECAVLHSQPNSPIKSGGMIQNC